jgi:hypothetical protein
MIEAVLWMAGGALAVFVGLVFYAAWVDVMDEAERHDFKHRHHHK